MRKVFILLLIILVFPFNAKSGDTAKELYEKGVHTLEKGFLGGDPDKAIEIFRKVIDIYPDSEYAVLAEVKIADAYFKKKEYRVAVDLYREFLEKRPDFPQVDYLLYQIGRCFYHLTPAYDRDLSYAKSGITYLQMLISKYPVSPYVEPARKMLADLKEKMAKREIYVGKFYMKEGDMESAKRHFKEAERWTENEKTMKKIRSYLKRIEKWEKSE